MFKVEERKFGPHTKLKLVNARSKEYVAIIPGYGANLNELVLANKTGRHSIIDSDLSYAGLTESQWFKGAKLIPFPNRVNNGEYRFAGKKYLLPKNFPSQAHAIHGLVYNKSFNVNKVHTKKDSASIDLEYCYDNEVKGYPFGLRIIIRYLFSERGLVCNTEVENISDGKIPFGDGWHPYFKTYGKVDNLFLELPSKKIICIDKRMIPTGEKIISNKFSALRRIEKEEFDTGFLLPVKEGVATTKIFDSEKEIEICAWQDTGKMKYNYLQIFIPPSRKSIAVEPMTCNTDAFNNKEGLIVLDPGQTFKASYGVYIRKH
jgi:aldose 1-epimerase